MISSRTQKPLVPWKRGFRDRGKQVAGWLSAGFEFLFGSRVRSRFGILVYHRIAPRYSNATEPTMNVTPLRFGQQIAALKQAGFTILPLQELLRNCTAGEPLPERTTAITFDDGFESVYKYAFPVLREHRVPATIFLSTAYIDRAEPFPFDPWGKEYWGSVPEEAYRPMTTPQCHEVLESGWIELGAHTHTHQDFRKRPDEFRDDLSTSVRWLRENLGLNEITFAFPFGRKNMGYVDDALVEAAKQTGVLCSLTTEAELVHPNSSPFDWGRFNAYDWDTGSTLTAKLQGWYTWAPRLEEWFARKKR